MLSYYSNILPDQRYLFSPLIYTSKIVHEINKQFIIHTYLISGEMLGENIYQNDL